MTVCFHVVVRVLIESAKGVVVIQLIVESQAPFKEWVLCRVLLPVVNDPQRVGKDGLFKLAFLPTFIVSPEEVGKQFQPSGSVGQVGSLVVGIAMPLAAPRGQFHTQAIAFWPFGVDDDDGVDCRIIAGTGILYHLHILDVVRLDISQFI